jgi:protein phosphatase
MPWSAKAQELLRRQYGPTVAAAKASAAVLLEAIGEGRQIEGLDTLRAAASARLANATEMERTIAGYCWDAVSADDYRIAPFHLLVAEGHIYSDAPHPWHMEQLAKLAAHDPILQSTAWRRLGYYNECLLIGDELPRQADPGSKKHLGNNHSTENRHKRT